MARYLTRGSVGMCIAVTSKKSNRPSENRVRLSQMMKAPIPEAKEYGGVLENFEIGRQSESCLRICNTYLMRSNRLKADQQMEKLDTEQ